MGRGWMFRFWGGVGGACGCGVWGGVWWADVTILRYEGMMYEMHWVEFPERVWGGCMRWGKAE